jgi:hypothetical protein
MSELTDRITAVLREHDGWGFNGWIGGDQMQQLCECGHLFVGGIDVHAAHVAAAVAAELNLTEDPTPYSRFASDGRTVIQVRRWVSPWVAVENNQ